MPTSQNRLSARTAVVLASALLAAACASGPSASRPVPSTAVVVGPWTGVEEQRFGAVLAAFGSKTGVRIEYVAAPHGVIAALDDRRSRGLPVDVAFVPQPGVLQQLARQGRIRPLPSRAAREVRSSFSKVWQQLGTVDGHLYAVWFKAADKSLIWYNIGVFERAHEVPVDSVAGLATLASSFRKLGMPAFSVGGRDGWTLTDWFENLYLSTEGSQRYVLLSQHRLPWTDGSVQQTLRLMAEILQPGNLAGGTAGALATSYQASVTQTFASPPAAAMVFEGDFVAGAITGTTRDQLGVDADVFRFPPPGPSWPWIIGGGDAAVLMSPSPSASSFVQFLATPEAATIWAEKGGFISPNLDVDPNVYPDTISREIAQSVLDAGDSFLFDLSDLQPARFGADPGHGMLGDLQQFLAHPNVDATAARLESDASAAYGP